MVTNSRWKSFEKITEWLNKNAKIQLELTNKRPDLQPLLLALRVGHLYTAALHEGHLCTASEPLTELTKVSQWALCPQQTHAHASPSTSLLSTGLDCHKLHSERHLVSTGKHCKLASCLSLEAQHCRGKESQPEITYQQLWIWMRSGEGVLDNGMWMGGRRHPAFGAWPVSPRPSFRPFCPARAAADLLRFCTKKVAEDLECGSQSDCVEQCPHPLPSSLEAHGEVCSCCFTPDKLRVFLVLPAVTLRCVTVLLPCAQTSGKSLEHSDESLATIAEQRQRAWKTRLVFE